MKEWNEKWGKREAKKDQIIITDAIPA